MLRAVTDPRIVAAREAGFTEADLSVIANFQQRVTAFNTAERELMAIGAAIARSGDNALAAEYGELMARRDSLKSKIQAATSAIDTAVRWARNALGLDGLRALSGLGVLPLVAIAVIAAAVAALGYWLTDYAGLATRLNAQQRIAGELTAAGVDPREANRQASEVVADSRPAGTLDVIAGLLKYAVIAGVGWWAWQTFAKRR